MSKWAVRVEVDDPDDHNAGEVRDLVKWALEDAVPTSDMKIGAITVTVPEEGSSGHVRSERHYPRRVR